MRREQTRDSPLMAGRCFARFALPIRSAPVSSKEQIFNGDLRPGERVVEQKFARQFGVGQNAIREALIELAHLGFVRRVPTKGTYVTKVTPEDAVKIARVRRALEGLAIELILERAHTEKPWDVSSRFWRNCWACDRCY